MKQFVLTILWLFLGTTIVHAAPDNNTTAPLRIMPLGDSITYGIEALDDQVYDKIGGYRSFLWYMLKDANRTVNFVGSRKTGHHLQPAIDPDNEGHPGWRMLEIADITYSVISHHQPDIVLLHIGTNDRGTTSPDGVKKILDEINIYEHDSGKKIRVIVALIIDRQSGDKRIKTFNQRLEKFLKQRIINGDNITMVDMYRGAGLTGSDYANNTHPNDSGYWKMAKVWFNAIVSPYTETLYAFPHTVVLSSYIESLTVNETSKSVTFVTELPNTGITF